MTNAPRNDLELAGCTPEPLMAYLKALGILRLVSEQKDPEARGWWKDDVFWLRSTLDKDALVRFFLDEYKPTPIVSPWNGDGGFLSDSGTSVETIKSFRGNKLPRFHRISDAIEAVDKIPLMSEFRKKRDRANELEKKKNAKTITATERRELREVMNRARQIKQTIVIGIRSGFSDASLGWLDACMTIGLNRFTSSPLLGSGGLDGKLDFGANFLANCLEVLNPNKSASTRSTSLLKQALFREAVQLEKSSIGQFSPGQVGAPNSTQGFEGKSIINPWDFILMMEGTLVLAGAAVRRLSVTGSARAAFPFTVRAVAAGFDASASKDEAESRGELWLPLWSRPTSAKELFYLFGEGRAEVSGRAARNGLDFARAAASLGVDRGITDFSRLGFLKRSGKAFLATPLGRFEVVERAEVDLLREVDPWLDRFRSAASDKNAPPRFASALRRMESAVFDFCKYGGKGFFQRILIALGAAERELASAERFRADKNLKPLAGLSEDWINAACDSSPEFALARSLAFLHDTERKIGPLRANLEPVDWRKSCRAWAEKDRSVVWNAADLASNLANVLARRMMDGARAGCARLPMTSPCAAPLETVAAFLAGGLDDARIEELLWGLMLVDPRKGVQSASGEKRSPDGTDGPTPPPLPREYALLKLLFLPGPLVPVGDGDNVKWHIGEGDGGIAIRPEPRIVPLLCAGRIGEACRIAARRLRASGLPPMPGPLPTGRMRDDFWAEQPNDPRRGRRLAAALLMPIPSASVDSLVKLVCRADDSAAAEILAALAEGGTE